MVFNIQDFLRDMRAEQKDDHDALRSEVMSALDTINEHETRIALVEDTQKRSGRLGWYVFGVVLVFVADLILKHI